MYKGITQCFENYIVNRYIDIMNISNALLYIVFYSNLQYPLTLISVLSICIHVDIDMHRHKEQGIEVGYIKNPGMIGNNDKHHIVFM